MKELDATTATEYWKVEVRWDSTNKCFSSYEEAETYARSRITKLLAHPTAGPKVNGKKPATGLVVNWHDKPFDNFNLGSKRVVNVLHGVVGYQSSPNDAPWFFSGHFGVLVKHFTRN